jgi:sulfopyruvate decarboxylase TPP-binding subunit
MIDEEKRLKNKSLVRWDFEVEANNLRALELLPSINKIMNVPIELVTSKESNKKDQCEECAYKRAVQEILNILELCKIVKKGEKDAESKPKGYEIKVE